MTDKIPDEIMQAAMRVACDTECMPSDGNLHIIARALMARDQRAAEIARRHHDECMYSAGYAQTDEGWKPLQRSFPDGDATTHNSWISKANALHYLSHAILSYDEVQHSSHWKVRAEKAEATLIEKDKEIAALREALERVPDEAGHWAYVYCRVHIGSEYEDEISAFVTQKVRSFVERALEARNVGGKDD